MLLAQFLSDSQRTGNTGAITGQQDTLHQKNRRKTRAGVSLLQRLLPMNTVLTLDLLLTTLASRAWSRGPWAAAAASGLFLVLSQSVACTVGYEFSTHKPLCLK